ncbi:MAG: transposase [Planctomycetota bacterium]
MPKFTVDEKVKIVVLTFDPSANLDGICRKYGITMSQLREWKETFIRGAKQALSRPSRDTQEIRKNLEQVRKDLTRFLHKKENEGS